ncbi:MAG TPA: peptidyl-prolyl cis-trans isomerase [Anaeromyxobacteraceae bacterium]|nr:peptidyl-prolyl cis-trans isomerase [Anaeromyxobacteraceae bacterium]
MIRRLVPLAALAVAALAAAACRGDRGGPDEKGPRAVAYVNQEAITDEALRRELAQSRASGGEGEDRLDVLRRRVLDEMIDRALLLQQARARSIVVGQDQVERAFLRVRSEYPGTHFDDLLAQEKLSQAELKRHLEDQLTIERLFNEEVFPKVTVAGEEIARYHADHPQEFESPESAHVLQIVVASREEAQRLRAELVKKPAAFAEVARRASIAPEGKDGGDLGFIGRGSGYPEVFDVCFALPLNKLSDVTPSPYGFHLFKVLERRPASKRGLDEAQGEIEAKLARAKRARAQQEYLDGLRKSAVIKIDEAALAAVTP